MLVNLHVPSIVRVCLSHDHFNILCSEGSFVVYSVTVL